MLLLRFSQVTANLLQNVSIQNCVSNTDIYCKEIEKQTSFHTHNMGILYKHELTNSNACAIC